MLPWADVVTESFTPKTLRNWGLDYDSMRAIRPDLIMLSTCMQGQTGPIALSRVRQPDGSAIGFLSISGYSEAEPCPPYGAYTISSRHDFPHASHRRARPSPPHRQGRIHRHGAVRSRATQPGPVSPDYSATGRMQGPGGDQIQDVTLRTAPINASTKMVMVAGLRSRSLMTHSGPRCCKCSARLAMRVSRRTRHGSRTHRRSTNL